MVVNEDPKRSPGRLLPVSIHPGANLEDAGFSDGQRTDLLGWILQVGAGAAGAALGVKDVFYDVQSGYASIRLEILGPSGHGHVDVVLAVEDTEKEGQEGRNIINTVPADLKSFGALTDQYIATITGPVIVAQQLSLLDGEGHPCW